MFLHLVYILTNKKTSYKKVAILKLADLKSLMITIEDLSNEFSRTFWRNSL